MDKRKIRGVQLNDAHSIHYFQMSDGELSMTVDCVHGNCIITEKELLSYLQTRNSLKTAERNDSGGVAGGLGTANSAITPCAHEWILIEGNPVVVNTDICVKCHAIKTHTAQ